jgi:uncharacterized protein DUF3427
MPISFAKIKVGSEYSRHELARLWGYKAYQALARGVVTPRSDNKIVLFITEEKQESAEQYKDSLKGSILEWEGPNDHFAEQRMVSAARSGEEIHVFYRDRHHTEFRYIGQAKVKSTTLRIGTPSSFTFEV